MKIINTLKSICLISCALQTAGAMDWPHTSKEPKPDTNLSNAAILTPTQQGQKRGHEEEESTSTSSTEPDKKCPRLNTETAEDNATQMNLAEEEQEQELTPPLTPVDAEETLSIMPSLYGELSEEVILNIIDQSDRATPQDLNVLLNLARTNQAHRELIEEHFRRIMTNDGPLFSNDLQPMPLFSNNDMPWFTTYAFRQLWTYVLSQLAAASQHQTATGAPSNMALSQLPSLLNHWNQYFFKNKSTAFANLCAYLQGSLLYCSGCPAHIDLAGLYRSFKSEYQLHLYHKMPWAQELGIMLRVLLLDQAPETMFMEMKSDPVFSNKAISEHIMKLFIEDKTYLYRQLLNKLSINTLSALVTTFFNIGVTNQKIKNGPKLENETLIKVLREGVEVLEKYMNLITKNSDLYQMLGKMYLKLSHAVEATDKPIPDRDNLLTQYTLSAEGNLVKASEMYKAALRSGLLPLPQFSYCRGQQRKISILLGKLAEKRLGSLKNAVTYYIRAVQIPETIYNPTLVPPELLKKSREKTDALKEKILTLTEKMVGGKEDFSAEVITWLNKCLNDGEEHGTDPAVILGKIYFYGLGVEQDLPKAMKFFADMDYYDNKWINELETTITPYNNSEQQLTDADGLKLAQIFKKTLLSVPELKYDECIKERYAPYIKMVTEWLKAKAEITSSSEIKLLIGYYYLIGLAGEENIEIGEQLIFQEAEQKDDSKKNYFAINYKIARSKGQSVHRAIILSEMASEDEKIIKDIGDLSIKYEDENEEAEEEKES